MVDRDAVSRGDTVVLTIQVTARGNEPVRIGNLDLVGLELVETRESSRVQMTGGVAQRFTERVVRLVARTPGRGTIAGLRVEQGSRAAEAPAISVTVTPVEAAATSLDPAVRRLLDGSEPPAAPDQVMVQLVPSRDAVVLGDQVDLVTVAWFPREIRSRVRAVPVFEAPDVQGAWTYQHAGPAGVAVSRRVGDHWYDAYVQYQTVFPLTTGALRVGRASVAYSLPLTYSFLSRELRHVVLSDSAVIRVSPYPETGRPSGFTGAAGGALVERLEPTTHELSVGDARQVTVSLEGRGNVALWPEPRLEWPSGLRAYPGEVHVSVSRQEGMVRGAKTFTYLLVADSAGRYRVRPGVYSYYDLDARRYVQLTAAPLEVVARPGPGPAALRIEPPPLMRAVPPRLAFVSRLPPAAWVALGALPMLLLMVARWRRVPVRRVRPVARPDGGGLDSLDRRFRRELERLVPRAPWRDGEGLADALRAAGVEAPLASQVARVRDRLRQALYGPGGATDADELRAEVQEVLRALVGERSGAPRSGAFTRVSLALLLLPAVARAQAASPERLYEAGAVRAAADSFAARAAREPLVAAHWYNLGNAWYRLGADARAEAAWLKAARIAPRHAVVERASELVPLPDAWSEGLLWVGPVAPDEALAGGAAAWLLGSVLLLFRRWRPIALGFMVAGAGLGGYAGLTLRRYHRPAAVVLADTPLREAPYGSAQALLRLREGSAVVIERTRPGWYLVRHAGAQGWVLRGEVLTL